MGFNQRDAGRRIRSWLVDSGMQQEELAECIGVRPGTLKSWIYAQRNMSLEDAVAIADVFGKSLDELACRNGRGE